MLSHLCGKQASTVQKSTQQSPSKTTTSIVERNGPLPSPLGLSALNAREQQQSLRTQPLAHDALKQQQRTEYFPRTV